MADRAVDPASFAPGSKSVRYTWDETAKPRRYPDHGHRATVSWGEGTINRGVIQRLGQVLYDLDKMGHDLRTVSVVTQWVPERHRWEAAVFSGCEMALERAWLNGGGA